MKLILSIIPTTIFVLFSCANPVSPTGGPKDESGPVLLKTTIADKSLNTKPEKITFYFDENIQVSNPKEKINISPLPKKDVKYSIANKNITIEFPKESLTDNTTYSIQLNESVTDLNEGNKTESKTFVFSTGEYIDTHFVQGTILPTESIDINKIKILLYQKENNIYKGNIDKNKFNVSNIKKQPTTIIALIDANNNNFLDSTENFGYYNGDTENDSIQITVYSVKKKIVETYISNNKIYLTGIPQTLVNTLDKKTISQYKDTLFTDTLLFQDNILQYIPEVYFISSLKNKRSSSFQYELIDKTNNGNGENTLTYSFNENILHVITDSIFIISKENINIKPKNIFFSNNIVTITCDSGETGKLYIAKNSIVNQYNNTNTKSIDEELNNFVSHGTVEIQNPFPYPISLEISNSQSKKYIYIEKNKSERLLLKPGSYKGSYFIDENRDHLLSPPIVNVRKGEKWALLPDIIVDTKLENVIILK